jgi:hypothetical protein
MIQPTSEKVYFAEVLPTLADRHQQVLKALATVENTTNTELSRMLSWEINLVTPRVHELVHPKDKDKKPLVEEACKRQCRITGRTAIAWRVVTHVEKSQSVLLKKNRGKGICLRATAASAPRGI